MSKFFLLMVCVLTGLLVLACAAPTTNRNAETPSTAAPGTSSATTNRNDNTTPGETVGIAECDDFIKAYETCVAGKVPEAARANLRASVTTWRTEWKRMADNPQTRASLAAHCKTQRDATMASMKAYNCAW